MEDPGRKLADKLDSKAADLYYDAGHVPSEPRAGVEGGLEEIARRLAERLLEQAEFAERMAADPVPEVTSKDFEDIVRKNRVVFLFFTADWCGPCISFLEVFRSVAVKYLRPGVFFGRVDVDRSFSLADRLGVQHIPTIIVLVDGTPVGTIVGRSSREKLEQFVKSYIAKAGL